MAEYVMIYTDITPIDSNLEQKVFVRYQLLDELAQSMGIPAHLLAKGRFPCPNEPVPDEKPGKEAQG